MEERIARAVVWAATVWIFLAAFWGIDATPGGGHLGSSGAGCAMLGEHMIRYHTFYPFWDWYQAAKPPIDHAYSHHPYGTFWVEAFFSLFFRHKDFVISLPAVIESTAMPWLLYGIGRRMGAGRAGGGEMAGAAAAVGFVVLPLVIGYSCFASLEVLTMFGAALFFWGWLNYEESRKGKHLFATLAGVVVACFGDWPGYLLIAPLLGFALLRGFVFTRFMPHVKMHYLRAWAFSVALAVLTLVITLGMFKHADRLGDWLASAEGRGGGKDIPIAAVLESRSAWIEFSFTPLAILLGKIAVPIAIVRVVWRRRDEEVMSLAALFGAVAQYLGFKGGADVHIFWPHYFGLYFALAMGQLAATAGGVAAFVAKAARSTIPPPAYAMAAAMAFGIIPSLVIFPDGFRSLKIWRATGGRYDDRGALFRSHVDLNWLLAKLVRHRLRIGERMGVHPGTQWGWEHQWAIMGESTPANQPSSHLPFWVGRGSGMSSSEVQSLVSAHHVRFYGDVLYVESSDMPFAPLDAYSTHEREPNLLEWFFAYSTEPVRTLDDKPDPFLTWEWRDHLGQPASPPTQAPATLDERRIAHNAAVARGDGAEAERLREVIVGDLDRGVEAHFSGGHTLIGVRVTHGVKPMLESWFEAGGPTAGDTEFAVHSIIEAKSPTSLIPIDKTVRDMAFPPSLSTKLWKKGYVYHIDAELKHRIGRERYEGVFISRDGQPAPTAASGGAVVLAVLP